jgi:hypothetical protein
MFAQKSNSALNLGAFGLEIVTVWEKMIFVSLEIRARSVIHELMVLHGTGFYKRNYKGS